MAHKDLTARNAEIARKLDAKTPIPELMREYGFRSRSQVYRAADAGRRTDDFSGGNPPTVPGGWDYGAKIDLTSGMLYQQLARSGLRRFAGRVDDDYDRVMRTFQKRMQLYREMGDDPIVAAILNASKLTLRRVAWRVEPGGLKPQDDEAADFLEQSMNDMAQTWSDTIEQALGEIQYGFQACELVYKNRRGPDNSKAQSRYDDGRIGWRKWTFMAPESLAPGREWEFDEFGGVQGINQQPPPDYKFIQLPIEKCILFRASTEKNNPEGRSLLRAIYAPWYYKKNLEEVEAISAERMGTGLPVMYLGDGVAKDPSSGTDLDTYKGALRNIRVDEQMGLLIPHPKQLADGRGVLFELVSPPSKGIVDMNQVITRYEQRMAMVGLGQFIMLGMSRIGTQALAREDIDFFTLAVSAWADSLEDTIHRYATERLFRVNFFDDLTDLPRIKHETVSKTPLVDIADYLNKLAGTQLVTPGPELEDYLRQLADLPERPATLATKTVQSDWGVPQSNLGQTGTPTPGPESSGPRDTPPDRPNPHEPAPEQQAAADESDTFDADDTPEELAELATAAEHLAAAIMAAEVHEENRSEHLTEHLLRATEQAASRPIVIRNEPQPVNVSVPVSATAPVTVDNTGLAQALEQQKPPVVNFAAGEVRVPETKIDVHVAPSLAPAPVVQVNVPQPKVDVHNEVHVPETNVQVTNDVHLPHTTTETTEVERDKGGQIARTRRTTRYDTDKDDKP